MKKLIIVSILSLIFSLNTYSQRLYEEQAKEAENSSDDPDTSSNQNSDAVDADFEEVQDEAKEEVKEEAKP